MARTRTETFHNPATTGLLRRTLTALQVWISRSNDRRCLARLDPHLLRDIGIDPKVVAAEAAKPFWRG